VSKKFFKRKFERYLKYFFIYLLILLARILPRKTGMKLFSNLGKTASNVFRVERRKAMQNLAIAFPEAPAMVRNAVTTAMYKTLGQNIFEFLNLKGISGQKIESLIESVEGDGYLREAIDEGNGVIAVTGYIGCWELLAAYLVSQGHSVSVVAHHQRDARWQERVESIRSSLNISVIDRDNGAGEMLDVLHNKGILGVLMDQDTPVRGYFVPFFNKPAYTPSVVAELAATSGAKIVPMAIYITPRYQHIIRILEPISFPHGSTNKARAIESVTSACAKAIEDLIRKDPKQWIWWHDRWSEKH
jgi:KDO2-lipid IV(A) lauroyltransferase